MKTCVRTKTFMWMFIASLITTAKNWKQPKCLLIEEWKNKMWYPNSGNKNKCPFDMHKKVSASQNHYAESKKPDPKMFMMYDFIYIKF